MTEIRSCEKCIRGPVPKVMESVYCAQCGVDLVYFVPTNVENINYGEKYAHVMSAPELKKCSGRIIQLVVHAYDEADNLMFKMKSFDEFTVEVEWKTLIGNSNVEECVKALRDAVEMMKLEG